MLEPLIFSDIRVGESNSDEHILIETDISDRAMEEVWSDSAMLDQSDVISLRDWLNEWIARHS